MDIRTIHQLALEEGRRLQSSQTGYVHYNYQNPEGPHDSIPLKENMLFVLSLLHSKVAEQMQEAKQLLEGLLAFQAPDGNFPIYLHNYPRAQDRFLVIQLLPALLWIQRLYSRIMSEELTQRLAESIRRSMEYARGVAEEIRLPYHYRALLAAAMTVQGEVFSDSFWEELSCGSNEVAWYSPARLGDLLVALRLWQLREPEGRWPALWEHLALTWHRQTAQYCGPAMELYYREGEVETTVYDLFLAYLSQSFPERLKKPHVALLQGSLVQPFTQPLTLPSLPFQREGVVGERRWHLTQEERWAYAALERMGSESPAWIRGFHPFRLLWGNRTHSCSLVCQGGKGRLKWREAERGAVVFELEREDELVDTTRRGERLLSYYIGRGADVRWCVSGQACTCFSAGSILSCIASGLELSFQWELFEDRRTCVGHLHPGNRQALRGVDRFSALDWHVFLRGIDTQAPKRLLARIQWKEEEL